MLKAWKKSTLIMVALTVLATNAHSEIEVVGSESQVAEVAISRYEQNLIEIKDRKISSVIPSVNGSLAYQKDNTNGVLYFTLANPNFLGTISVFVNDDEGERYKLILVPTQQAAQEIIIVPPTRPLDDGSSGVDSLDLKEKSGSYIYEIKRMMFDLGRAGNGENTQDVMNKIVVNQKIPLWKQADLVLANRYDNGVLMGEEYYMTNITSKTLVIREQEFYRNNVLAVSVDKLNLEPNETTIVYVVRGR